MAISIGKAITNAASLSWSVLTGKPTTLAGYGITDGAPNTVFTSSTKGLAPLSGGGTANFLRADGTWAAPAGGSGISGSATVTIAIPAFDVEQIITATGVTSSSKIFVSLQAGSDSDENTADMLDLIAIAGIPGTDQITIQATFATPTSGPVLINWSAT